MTSPSRHAPLALVALLLAVLPLLPVRAADAEAPSNMLRSDYVGAAKCGSCHEDKLRSWSTSPMRRMTRLGDAPDVAAPFDGATFTFKGETVRTETMDGRLLAHLDGALTGARTYRITKIIGGRVREDFAGVDVTDDPTRDPAPTEEEFILPMSWVIGPEGGWRYKGYSVMVKERPGIHVSAAWNRTCMFCHNTVPELSRALGAIYGPGSPGYQGADLDTKLPEALRWQWTVSDPDGLARALRDELAFLGAPAPAPSASVQDVLRSTIDASREHLRQAHVVDIGIGCESCHGGGRQHAEDPWIVSPSFLPQSPWMALATGTEAPSRAVQINRTCAKCHSVLFSRYPLTWEGGRRSDDPGGSTGNSGEGRDFLMGGCASEMSCTSCHDPHAKDDPQLAARLATPAGNPVCTSCHAELAASDALAAHTHHDPQGPGSACVQCHMPQKNIALQTRLTAYHRVASPNAPAKLANDRPLECALCHTDKTVGQLADAMERWWPTPVDRAALVALYGSLEADPLGVALSRGAPHEQIVAMHVLGEHEVKAAIPGIARHMTHPYPQVRYHAERVLEGLLGQPAPVDLHQERAAIDAEVRAWLARDGQPDR